MEGSIFNKKKNPAQIPVLDLLGLLFMKSTIYSTIPETSLFLTLYEEKINCHHIIIMLRLDRVVSTKVSYLR
jgi:hypothetical protein